MTDVIEDAFKQTGEIATELAVKAREARAQGTSRREFFARTATLAGASALGVAGAGLLQPLAVAAAATTTSGSSINDTLQTIVDIAATAEALATTFYINALQHRKALPNVNSPANRNYFQAASVQEALHLHYLKKELGAVPATTSFYFPDKMFTDEAVFFSTAGVLEDYFISAYLAAAMEFSGVVSTGITTPNPFAIGLAVQIAGIECEHRALLRVASNSNPPNNVVVETALLTSVGEAVGPLTPFLQGGVGFTGPFKLPTASEIEGISHPYGFGFFPKFTVV